MHAGERKDISVNIIDSFISTLYFMPSISLPKHNFYSALCADTNIQSETHVLRLTAKFKSEYNSPDLIYLKGETGESWLHDTVA